MAAHGESMVVVTISSKSLRAVSKWRVLPQASMQMFQVTKSGELFWLCIVRSMRKQSCARLAFLYKVITMFHALRGTGRTREAKTWSG